MMKPLYNMYKFMGTTSAIMSILTMSFMMKSNLIMVEWQITLMKNIYLTLPIIIDMYNVLFSFIVLFISMNVFMFASMYMMHEKFNRRFSILVLMFIGSMNLLIFIPNLMILLIGWDGLGLTSFLLVIYYQNSKSLGAGLLTALTNRLGDVMLLLSISWMMNMQSWNIMLTWSKNLDNMFVVMVVIAAMTKSAQMPFSSWLPAAMAAPTPVSALVHSSTLVTAGVFLIYRFYPYLSKNMYFSKFLLLTATMTTLMAGISAMLECDMKKVVALSTLSQLGVMMVSMSMKAPNFAFFHLITHALFKALLFLCAGSIIHYHYHSQDLRFMSNWSIQMPSLMMPLMIANMALCGMPFMAGFYSKDQILEFMMFNQMNFVFVSLFILSTLMTSTYTLRFLMNTVFAKNLSLPMNTSSDTNNTNTLATMMLASGAVMSGSTLNWLMLTPLSCNIMSASLKFMPLMLIVIAFMLITMGSKSKVSHLLRFGKLNEMNTSMWFMTNMSTQIMISPSMMWAHKTLKILDHGWNEYTSGKGTLKMTSMMSKEIMKVNFTSLSQGLGMMLMSISMLTLIM